MHLGEEQIQRLLHGELDAASKESRHAAECESCARRLEAARREEQAIFDLLGSLDHPAPRVTPATLLPKSRPAPGVWVRRAAGVVVVAALAGAAYAIPGSPLPALVRQVAGWITGATEAPTPPPDDVTPERSEPVTSGIAVPVHERLAIHFVGEQTGGVALVSLTDSADVVVRVRGGTATFTTGTDSLTIENRGSTTGYEIEIPRTARVDITGGGHFGHLYFRNPNSGLDDYAADPQGRIVLNLFPPLPPSLR